jgi:hypothetical protein
MKNASDRNKQTRLKTKKNSLSLKMFDRHYSNCNDKGKMSEKTGTQYLRNVEQL